MRSKKNEKVCSLWNLSFKYIQGLLKVNMPFRTAMSVTTSLKNGQIKAASKQKVREMKGDEMIQGPKKCKAAETCFETDTFPAFSMP